LEGIDEYEPRGNGDGQEEDKEPERSPTPSTAASVEGRKPLQWGYRSSTGGVATPEAEHPEKGIAGVESAEGNLKTAERKIPLSAAEELSLKVAKALESIEVPTALISSSPRATMNATRKKMFVDRETERVSNIMFGLFK